MGYKLSFGVEGAMQEPVAVFDEVDGPLPVEGTIILLPAGKFRSTGISSFAYDERGKLSVMLAVKPHKERTARLLV